MMTVVTVGTVLREDALESLSRGGRAEATVKPKQIGYSQPSLWT